MMAALRLLQKEPRSRGSTSGAEVGSAFSPTEKAGSAVNRQPRPFLCNSGRSGDGFRREIEPLPPGLWPLSVTERRVRSRPTQTGEQRMWQRLRSKEIIPLRERLSEQAARWREQAKALPAGGRNER